MNIKFDHDMLNKITNRLVKVYQPVAIYLFGSYAWGEPDKYSDLDLFIIVDKSDLDSAERIRIGARELKDIEMGVDILVFTKDEFQEKKDHPSTLTHKVLTKGVKLYGAA